MTRFGLVAVALILNAVRVGAADPATGRVPKELLEKRLEAARTVFRLNLARVKAAQAQPSDVFGWSERLRAPNPASHVRVSTASKPRP
jgi:hypothetical protein